MSDLKAFYQALADRPLSPSDPDYEQCYLRDLHLGPNGQDMIGKLATQILWDVGGGAYLFTGQRGTGKSTELLRLRKKLEDEGCVAFYLDMSRYLNLTVQVDAADFLISLLGGFSEEIKTRYQEDPGHRGYWERVWAFLNSEVKIEGIEATIPAGNAEVSLKAALQSDPDFKKRLQGGTRGHLARIKRDAQQFADDAIDLIKKKTGESDPKVVLLVDSIEQIRGIGAAAEEVFASVQELFSGQSQNLKFPGLHIVYTIPPYLLAISNSLSAYYEGGKVYALSSVHLFTECSRDVSADGMQQMVDIVARRYADWAQVFTDEQLRDLAESSGGDIRDYFRLIRLCLASSSEKQGGGANRRMLASMIQSAKNDLRADMLPIALDDLKWLKEISTSHDTRLKTNKDLPTLARFFEGKLVLNYRNGGNWYDVHPLLRDLVARCAD